MRRWYCRYCAITSAVSSPKVRRNPPRKVKEALLTRSLEKHLEKRRILEHYLNVVEFAPGSTLAFEKQHLTGLPIVQNGPPGTFVRFAGGGQVPVPTDQIVSTDDAAGHAAVGFGGMSFEGVTDGLLVFYRVMDLLPEAQLSPERGQRMTFEPRTVAAVRVDGRQVWPAARERA